MQNDCFERGLIPSEKPLCPQCGTADDVIPLIYGLPNLDAIELAAQGKLELGSRFYRKGAPCWRCTRCGQAFGQSG